MDDFEAANMPPSHPDQPLEPAEPRAPGSEQSTGKSDRPECPPEVPRGNFEVEMRQDGTGLDSAPVEGGEEGVRNVHNEMPASSSVACKGGVGESIDPGIVDRNVLSAQMGIAEICQGGRERGLEQVEEDSADKELGGKRVASPRAGLDEVDGEVEGVPKKQRVESDSD